MLSFKRISVGVASILCLLLAACGGGGKGTPGPSMSLSTKQVSWSETTDYGGGGSTPVDVTVSNPPATNLYVAYQATTNGIAKINVNLDSKTYTVFQIQFKSPQKIPPGTYKDTLKISVCLDKQCSKPIANSPQTVSVTYTVKLVPPTLSSITPKTVAPGNGAFELNVYGLGFLTGATVYWDGSPRHTTLISPGQATASIAASDVASSGTGSVTVVNPAPRSGVSNALSFPVQYATPSVSEILPPTVVAGNAAFTLKVKGNGYGTNSQVLWNGNPLTTQPVSGKELTAQVGASYVATVGTAEVTVKNPAPGSVSSPATFAVTSVTSDAVAAQVNANHSGTVHFQPVTFPSGYAWRQATSGLASYALIADGEVYEATQGSQPQLSAFNQATGTLSWGPIDLPGPSMATYDAGTVFVLSLVSQYYGTLQAYDAGTGALKWSTQLNGQWSTTVYALTGGVSALDGLVYATSSGGDLYAVNENSGAIAWTAHDVSGVGPPVVTPYGVFDSCSDFQPDTGALIWQPTYGCSVGGMSAVANADLYVPDAGNNYDGNVLDAQTGDHLGTYTADKPVAIGKSNGYFLKSGTLKDVDLGTGAVVWSFSGDGFLDTAPVVINHYVIVGSSMGNIYAIDSTTGNQVWQVNVRNAIPSGGSYNFATASLLSAGDGLLVASAYDSNQSGGGTWIIAYRLAIH